MGFFVKYMPEVLPKIGMLQTPVILVTKNDKVVDWKYSLHDTVTLKKGEVSDYKKGLGSWDIEDLKYIVEKDGLGKMIDFITIDDDEIIGKWLGDDSAPRKEFILNNDFSIAKL